MILSRISAAPERQAAAKELGFELVRGGGARVRDALAPGSTGEWIALVDRTPGVGERRGELGVPGPWRTVRANGRTARTCDLWLARVDAESDADAEGAPEPRGARPPFASALQWARATADGTLPDSWRAPAAAEVEGWLEPRRLAVRSGAHVAQAELTCEPTRLALRFPELVRVPGELGAPRVAWLREVCSAAQDRYRLVRLGLVEGVVQAEVDLTGVPSAMAPAMVELSFAALCRVVEWLLAPLHMIANPSVKSRALDLQLPWAPARTTNTRKVR